MADPLFEPREPGGVDAGDALRSLPLPTPPADSWPRLQARLAARRRQRRQRIGFALAASIALAAVLGSGVLPGPTDDPTAVTATATAPLPTEPDAVALPTTTERAALDALVDESRQLEALIAWSGEPWVETGDSAVLDQQLTERLQQVDLQLAMLDDQRGDELLLWSERVFLLRQRAQLASADLLLADGDRSAGESLLLL